MKRIAYCVIREQPCYRSDAFRAGLRAAGYDVKPHMPPAPYDETTTFVTWNRYGSNHEIATKVERAGGTVLVAENGYAGTDAQGLQLYALARHGHNGSGRWPMGAASRWEALGIAVAPWRTTGEHVLVCGQRSIGSPSMASPPNWHVDTAAQLRMLVNLPVVVRPHPMNNMGVQHPSTKPLEAQLRNAHAAVIWSSSAGVKALLAGIPVVYAAPHWICAPAATRGLPSVKQPVMDDSARLLALQAMAWAQWTVAEIATGEPFVRLRELENVCV